MKKLVILGAGTAGTMMLNKLTPLLDKREWQITIVDQHETHYYQP
jgi:sulfide:quinone oxidoreductase